MDDLIKRARKISLDPPGKWGLIQELADALESKDKDYSRVVGKFDACRAALAHVYESLTKKKPIPPNDFDGEWHIWLISEVEKALTALDKKK